MKDAEKILQKWPFSCHGLCQLLLECMKERDLNHGRRVHTFMSCIGHDTVSFCGDHLIRFFASCGCLDDADIAFRQVRAPTSYTWNSIISAHAKLGDGETAIQMYFKMQKEGIEPNRVTFSCTLKACSVVGDFYVGRIIHSQVLSNRAVIDLSIGNALVDMYAKCGSLQDAQRIFDELPIKDIITWGAIIGGHAAQGNGSLAFECYFKMHQCGVEVNDIVLLCVIKACCKGGLISQGKLVHHTVIVTGHDADVALGSALIDMLLQCGALDDARKVFENLAIKNVVAWGAIIGGYAQGELGHIVLELFVRMQREGLALNIVILLHVMKACGSLGTSTDGKVLHHQILETEYVSDIVLGSTTVDMYARCGDLYDAQKVFDMMTHKNVVTLGALVTGYARHGNCKMLKESLKDARLHGFQLDDLMFTSILTACCHSGLVEQGCFYFMSMREEYGIEPSMEQYSCLVHLLGCGGCLVEAEDMLQTMPILPDVGVLRSMLTSSRAHGHTLLGGWCLDQATQVDQIDAAGYVLLSNTYAEAQMFDSAEELMDLRKCSAAHKTPGKALIEVGRKSHEFTVGSKNPVNEDVFFKVNALSRLIKKEGFVPLAELVLHLFALDKQGDTSCKL